MADNANTPAAVVTALKDVLELEESLFGWAHTEEHWFEHVGYDALAEIFDKKVDHARMRRRPILDRIFQLGGMVDGTMGDPEAALEELLDRHRALHAACQAAYDAASDADDYVTVQLLACNQKHIEKCIEKLEAKLAKKIVLGDQLWLDRLI
jgi:bacterioferritin (cytochrome b1)